MNTYASNKAWVEFSSFSNSIVPNILLTGISVQDSELWLNLPLLLLLTVTFMSPEMHFFCLVLHVLDLLLVNQKNVFHVQRQHSVGILE